jgi:hypothetical protein
MEIKRCGSQSSGKGPADWFTGTVRIAPIAMGTSLLDPGRGGAAVARDALRDFLSYSFVAGSRTEAA